MKKILIIMLMLVATGISNFCFSKPSKPMVMGGYSSVIATEYRYAGGKPDVKTGQISYGLELDRNGNPIEMIYYNNNKITSRNKIMNKYNDEGLLVESTMFEVNANALDRHCYGYDKATNMIHDTLFNQKGEATTIGHHIYDNNNFMTEEIYEVRIDSNEYSRSATYFINDKYGNKTVESANRCTSISVEISADNPLGTGDSKIDSQVNTKPDDKLDKITYEYKYDDKGNILRQVRTSFDGYKLINEFKYDEFGNISEYISFDENGKPAMKTVFEYKK